MGIGGGFKPNKIFMMNLAKPGFDTIAIAAYIFGTCSAENFLVALSGTGDLAR